MTNIWSTPGSIASAFEKNVYPIVGWICDSFLLHVKSTVEPLSWFFNFNTVFFCYKIFIWFLYISLLSFYIFWILVLAPSFTFLNMITFGTLNTSIVVSWKALCSISDISALSKPFYGASFFSFCMNNTFLFLFIF